MPEQNVRNGLAIILPSLDPDEKFSAVVKGLVEYGFENIVIVDDGSAAENRKYFDNAEKNPCCHVLHHEVNKGKGRALKTAFSYVSEKLPELRGVVTIDGDGQHLLKDIVACGERLLEGGDRVILGCRDFDQPGVPPRSVAGNKTTSRLFRLLFGIRLSDTQTGLRAIPVRYLPELCAVEGERFEYETNMLLQMKRLSIAFEEQKIETVYDPEDYSSHYNALKDSWRILKVMLKYLFSSNRTGIGFAASSISTTAIDFAVFAALFALLKEKAGGFTELAATVIARVISSATNFLLNHKLVFKSKNSIRSSLVRYYCLAIPQMAASAGLVTLLNRCFSNSATLLTTLIKAVVDVSLFFLSFFIQKKWVFCKK